MNTARIAELLDIFLHAPIASSGSMPTRDHLDVSNNNAAPDVLSQDQLQSISISISTYIDILLRWNARINLTAIRDPEEIVRRHFGESLFAARHLYPEPCLKSARTDAPGAPVEPTSTDLSSTELVSTELSSTDLSSTTLSSTTLADIGSGAGFPGIPIKLWAPHLSLTLIESSHKKAAFLREVARSLTLTAVNILNARAETLTQTFDVVTLRAVERFEKILPVAASLLAPGGRLVLLIGAAQQAQAQAALPHLMWSNPIPIPYSRARILQVGRRSQ